MKFQTFMNKKNIALLAVIILAFWAGKMFTSNKPDIDHSGHKHAGQSSEKKNELWTCSMHPQIKKPGPGKCPICTMDLIPMNSGGEEDEGEKTLSMSEAAKKLAKIETTPVERKLVNKEIRMVGKIDYDEGRVKVITTRVGGRIDKLYVDYTGIHIKKGEHLISLYSPELYSAQEELIQASKNLTEFASNHSELTTETANATVDAARERLMQWGLTQTQIENVEKSGKASDHLTVYSPITGVVIHKNAVEGNYVKTGTTIYTIADLSEVWVKFDAYESDLNWLRMGQNVNFTVEAYPGEKFAGRISFIDPILNPKTRTVKVRVNVGNKKMQLKPDMYVTGTVFVKISPEGGIVDNYLAGKWIAPMHPEIVRKGPGKCPICGMNLVKAKTLGYVSSSKFSGVPLTIPASAALITGKRAIVYVELPDKARPTFEGREVVLGPRTGNSYIVKSGLVEGERVVTQGSFKIDAELQIRAKSSMMSPEGGVTPAGHNHGERGGKKPVEKPPTQMKKTATDKFTVSEKFMGELNGVYNAYFAAQKALASDDLKVAKKKLLAISEKAQKIDMKLVTGSAHMYWMKWIKTLKENLQPTALHDIKGVRKVFGKVSVSIIDLIETAGHKNAATLFKLHCPMALQGDGADWVQTSEKIENPFYGESMLSCGSVTKKYSGK